MAEKSLVKNVADPEQVKKAAEKVADARALAAKDMYELLNMPSGAFKRFVANMLAETRVSQSVWSQSAAIHRDAGRQEIGHLICRKVVEVDEKALAELLTDAYKKELEGEPL